MKTKGGLHLLSPFVLTWNGAKKGPDRFYARPDALSRSKRRGLYLFFQIVFIEKDDLIIMKCTFNY
ncbi:hypothetical protein COM55_00910 [Bacillus pseudomycoides]|nr:hypothetical protein CN590_14640 [Bacillus pseudomycoides]PEL28517.1 hypothetical protein CN608_10385 [Bacillus pseudomycoides]PGE88971.1 hypothetical protein COM55_00910 [Bacillus pseudomycoides]